METKTYYQLHKHEVEKELDTDIKKGLTSAEAKKRLKEFGGNKLPEKKKFTILSLFFNQFKNILIFILCVAAVVSFVLKDFVDGWIIVAAIGINVLVGFIQEFKAQSALEKLSKVITDYCVVIRDGNHKQILSEDLVPGDVVIMKLGDNIPADCRLAVVHDFEVNEASLTGESVPVEKNDAVLEGDRVLLGNRKNMCFMGTLATRGNAVGIVVGTGLKTELGKIATLIKETKEDKTPLQFKLDVFSKKLGTYILMACAFIFAVGIFLGKDSFEMFKVAVATAVAAIPEGLLIGITAILAIGMQRILKRKALVRKLVAAETLGSTDVVCCDKTGTLTEGQMKVSEVMTYRDIKTIKDLSRSEKKMTADVAMLLKIGMLCNNTYIENPNKAKEHWKYLGTPTEKAMFIAGLEAGLDINALRREFFKFEEDPFNSTRKFMVSLHKFNKENNVLLYSGAPERILDMSSYISENGKESNLTIRIKDKMADLHKKYTAKGLRLIGVGYKKVNLNIKKLKTAGDIENDVVFVGYHVIVDPIRAGVKETIQKAAAAGIRTVMITGDHRNTASYIAGELGLKVADHSIVDGEDLAKMSEYDFRSIIERINVFARVSPTDKIRIVEALKEKGRVVAMTGDGINDAPALKAADIGIAVGSGTDVTKGVADIILLDNNFKTIIAAIKEGRIIVDNIKKVIVYLLSSGFSEMILVLGSLLLGLPLPITAAQILWINLVTDGFPYFALTVEKGEKDVMKIKPRKKEESILDKEMKVLIFGVGIITDIILLILFNYYLGMVDEVRHAQTVVFATLGLNTLLYVFSVRSLRIPIWRINPFQNIYLIFAFFAGLFLHLLALYHPFFANMFKLSFLTLNDWFLIVIISLIRTIGIEFIKFIFARDLRKSN